MNTFELQLRIDQQRETIGRLQEQVEERDERIAKLEAEVARLTQLLGEYNEQIVTQEISALTGSQSKVCTPAPRHK